MLPTHREGCALFRGRACPRGWGLFDSTHGNGQAGSNSSRPGRTLEKAGDWRASPDGGCVRKHARRSLACVD
jgi:hypothetical protein